MPKLIHCAISPEKIIQKDFLWEEVAIHTGLAIENIQDIVILKKSIDARKKNITYQLQLEIYEKDEKLPLPKEIQRKYISVYQAPSVIIVGFGPAGMFAALNFLRLGIKPIIIEKGKNIKDRRRDLAAINKSQHVNKDSNYCFGEGGAGTFSDGKLYTRSTKRGDIKDVLESLVFHGAPNEILIEAHPHIGTNKLPKVVENIRACILAHGGEIHFNTSLTDFIIEKNEVKGVKTADGKEIIANNIILATGHSARDVYELLAKNNITIENKSFALGVRIEHPQSVINQMQYHGNANPEHLPPAAYNLVEQINGVGVYSFCMCPGGVIAPCATSPGEIVTNGWSPSKRNNYFANSGLVTEIRPEDWQEFKSYGQLAAMNFQKSIEQKAFVGQEMTPKICKGKSLQHKMYWTSYKKTIAMK